MQVQHCMSTDVCTISPDTPLRRAAEKMAEHDLGSIPVANDDKLIGMVTDRDIAIRGIGAGFGPETSASEVMTQERLYCSADDDINDVLENMASLQIRRLPVIDANKQLAGIVSIGDLVKVQPDDAGECFAKVARPSQVHSQALA
jgi:CBS domain-containing protein